MTRSKPNGGGAGGPRATGTRSSPSRPPWVFLGGIPGMGALLAPVLFALLVTATGCRSSGAERGVSGGNTAVSAAPSPAFAPALEAVGAALGAGDDETARQLLAALFGRGPTGADLEWADTYRNILEGRDFARGLDLSLQLRASGADGRGTIVDLVVAPRPEAPNTAGAKVDLGMPLLVRRTSRTDATGSQRLERESRAAAAAASFAVPVAGERAALELGTFELDLGGALAVREEWWIEWRSGFATTAAGVRLPVQQLRSTPVERNRIAAFLPTEPLGPEPLCESLVRADFEQIDPALRRAQLLERAVRIPRERREETLIAVAALLPDVPDSRLEDAAPALAWLARQAGQRSPAQWRHWFATRTAPTGNLELPETLEQDGP